MGGVSISDDSHGRTTACIDGDGAEVGETLAESVSLPLLVKAIGSPCEVGTAMGIKPECDFKWEIERFGLAKAGWEGWKDSAGRAGGMRSLDKNESQQGKSGGSD
jgi:hypothetical protein